MSSGITVVIPSIPPRRDYVCNRVLPSVYDQTLPPDEVLISIDHDKLGAGPTRTRALKKVTTEWVAFLDDDDELLPHHLATLHAHALETGADVVWPWYEMGNGGGDPLPHRGKQWDPKVPHTFPVTALVRTSWAQRCEFPPPERPDFSGDDWPYWLCLSNQGAKFSHVNEVTWRWWHHFTNTSGAPARW